MADDLNNLLGTVILSGIAIRALDRPHHHSTRTRTVFVNRRTGRPIKVVTKRTTSRPARKRFDSLNSRFFPF